MIKLGLVSIISYTQTVSDYIDFLLEKGFSFGEDVLGFIKFGQSYTGTNDEIVIAAIEFTLKIQKEFDGSFFISLLEMLKQEGIETRKGALRHIERLNLIEKTPTPRNK
ncbi:DUF6123 family protein [Metabacillus fastidiosus]|uniref:DUF6123 family protein n=1 Tax=Metabacillus fastidiosus TaxID=1458 RepID=UPI002E1A4FC1|nr:DUF6123 family protein [Metabacillus fastidiosus]